MIQFIKYQAAGNSYLIVKEENQLLSTLEAKQICDPNYGVGSDGVICWQKQNDSEPSVKVAIFNPDGSQAEKSGNGLRILATYLFEYIFKNTTKIILNTDDNPVTVNRLSSGSILLDMGRVVALFKLNQVDRFGHSIAKHTLKTPLGSISGYPVSLGNPHFVVFREKLSKDDIQLWGPHIENHPAFSNRTNVQFAKVTQRDHINAEIWERGVGYTLSSGSSSCAIAAVAHQLGYCDSGITVSMPGGELSVEIKEDKSVFLTGPVSKTVDGVFYLS